MKKVTIKSFKGTGTPDGNNVLNNIFDGKPDTRYSVKGKGNSIELDIDPNESWNGILLAMYKGDQRTNNLTFSYFNDKENDWKDTTFNTTGKTSGPEFIKFPSIQKGYSKLKLTFNGNSEGNDWFSVTGLEVIYDDGADPIPPNPPEPNKPEPEPEPNKPTDPVTGRKVKNVTYPAPKLNYDEGKKQRSVPFDKTTASKNYAKKHNVVVPLLTKKDKNGNPYFDIPKLISLLGLKLDNIKDHNYDNELYEVYENNNSDGESKRFDFRKAFMRQWVKIIDLFNESKDEGDEESDKHGGPHSDDICWEADCAITQFSNTGKTVVQQLEPSHMDKSDGGKHSYGEKFNEIEVNMPSSMGRKHSIGFIRLINMPTKEVITLVVVKYNDGKEGPKEWTCIYEGHVFDGMGGERGLKDPFTQWIGAVGKPEKCSSTIRMDKQPSTDIKKGYHYDNPRMTEIIDYE